MTRKALFMPAYLLRLRAGRFLLLAAIVCALVSARPGAVVADELLCGRPAFRGVGPTGHLTSYELREDFAEIARQNVARYHGAAPNWTLRRADAVAQGIDASSPRHWSSATG